jgi:hypothetical protein
MAPEEVAALAARLREDRDNGDVISRRKVADRYDVTPHNAQLAINAMSNGSAS